MDFASGTGILPTQFAYSLRLEMESPREAQNVTVLFAH